MSVLSNALLMTLIGMGLVFVGILLLWGLMALMVWILPERTNKKNGNGDEQTPVELPQTPDVHTAPESSDDLRRLAAAAAVAVAESGGELRRRAAVSAVAIALAMRQTGAAVLQQPVQSVSSWQAVLRANQLNQRLQMFNRKSRGSIR